MRVEERRLKTEADLNLDNPSLLTELPFTKCGYEDLVPFSSLGNIGPTLASVVDITRRHNSLGAACAASVCFCDARIRGSAILGSANAVWLGAPGQSAPSSDRRKPTKLRLCLSNLIAMILLH